MVLNFAWVFWLVGGVLGAAGLLVLVRAVWGDRSRGRRRCPKCWYDMAGAPSLVCPECGRDAGVEKRLLRTRRRWRWVGMGMVLAVVGAGTASAPRVANRGVLGAVPTSAVVVCACIGDSSGGDILAEALQRPLQTWETNALRKRSVRVLQNGYTRGRKPQLRFGSSPFVGSGTPRTLETTALVALVGLGMDEPSTSALIAIAQTEEISNLRLMWMDVLGTPSGLSVRATWVALVTKWLREDPTPYVQLRAVRLLGEPGVASVDSVEALRRALEGTSDRQTYEAVQMYEAVLSALENIGPTAAAAVPDLAEMLKDADDQRWRRVLEVLSRIRLGAGPVLCDALRGAGPSQRRHAFECLSRLGSEAAGCVGHLVARLEREPDGEMRVWCVSVLGSIGPAAVEAEPLLARLLDEDPHMDVRFVAIDSIIRIGAPTDRVVEYVAKGLKDPDGHVRLKACKVLADLGPTAAAARERVATLVSDSDQEVAREAARAMERLGEQR